METWKKIAVIGSAAAGVLLLIKGKRSLGAAFTTGGLVMLASEYPEQFEHVWNNAPEYVSRGSQIFNTVQRVAERFADEAQRSGMAGALKAVGSDYMR